MLFVSNKETPSFETFSDTSPTSTHGTSGYDNDDETRQRLQLHGVCKGSGDTLPAARLSKLNKQQLDLHHEFLRLGTVLMSQNADLFHQALCLLSAQHNLKVATPATSISDILPPSCTARSGRAYDLNNPVPSRPTFRKYTLPPEYADKEFYQCMVCKERRPTNSFSANHTHDGAPKSSVRWYCPVCDSFFAVTHRGYHIKSRHSDTVASSSHVQQSPATSLSESDQESCPCKRPWDSSSETASGAEDIYPAPKAQRLMDDTPLTATLSDSCEEEGDEGSSASGESVEQSVLSFSPSESCELLFSSVPDDGQQPGELFPSTGLFGNAEDGVSALVSSDDDEFSSAFSF